MRPLFPLSPSYYPPGTSIKPYVLPVPGSLIGGLAFTLTHSPIVVYLFDKKRSPNIHTIVKYLNGRGLQICDWEGDQWSACLIIDILCYLSRRQVPLTGIYRFSLSSLLSHTQSPKIRFIGVEILWIFER